jgi:hypothetical protein
MIKDLELGQVRCALLCDPNLREPIKLREQFYSILFYSPLDVDLLTALNNVHRSSINHPEVKSQLFSSLRRSRMVSTAAIDSIRWCRVVS